jgi:hypothetical protein
MNGLQIEHLLNLMEENAPFDQEKARGELAEYLTNHTADVAADLQKHGEAVIRTPSGTFWLTKEDLVAA